MNQENPTKGKQLAAMIMPFIVRGVDKPTNETLQEIETNIANSIDNAFKPEQAPTDEKTIGQMKKEADQLCREITGLIHQFYNRNHAVQLEFDITSPFKELAGGRKLRMPTVVSAKLIL